MRCQTCGYSLFNLTQPTCPECGTGFHLHDFRFEPGTVAFACPFCQHLHGGQGELYTPSDSQTALCNACGREMDIDHMPVVVLASDPDKAEAVPAEGVPWESRRRNGRFRSLWATVKLCMNKPGAFGKRLAMTTRFNDGYWFSVWVQVPQTLAFAALIGLLMLIFFVIGSNASQGPGSGQSPLVVAAGLGIFAFYFVMMCVGLMIGPLIYAVVLGGAAHLFLSITGPKRGGFNLTAVSALYGTGPQLFAPLAIILMFVPCVGNVATMILPVWSLVSTICILKEAQRVSGLRASFAVLILPISMMVLGCLTFGLVMWAASSQSYGPHYSTPPATTPYFVPAQPPSAPPHSPIQSP
ncbi:MAG: hypothetical protein GC164_09615 [Phycisphaera sp.]|nr:hypothetical protein [Phycisphaera sp.]